MIRISLRAARVNADMSLDKVAKIAKKSKKTIINWELGRTEIDPANFNALSQLYGIPIENIILPKNLPKRQGDSGG